MWVGGVVDDRADVEALEVDRVDRPGGDEPGDQLVGPRRRRVELEAERRVRVEAGSDRVERRRLAEAERDDEGDRPGLAAECLVEGEPGLAEGEVEGGR